jgi:hypothetical protein
MQLPRAQQIAGAPRPAALISCSPRTSAGASE